MPRPERPFNQPASRAGRAVFEVLGWLERLVAANSKVGATGFFEPALFPWLPSLCAAWKDVADEARAVLADGDLLPGFEEISREVGYITDDRRWKTFMLVGYGRKSHANLTRCPKTAALLRRVPGMRTAFFSVLEPGKRLPPHRGPYSGVLRMHLALVVPQPNERCWIRVGSERRCWRPGEALVFDDSLEHEVHNETAGVRVVLFVDFLRPCSWPVNWLNRAVVFLARFSPLVRSAARNQREWERRRYGPLPR